MKSRSRTTSSHWSVSVSRPTSPSVRAPKAPSTLVVATPQAPAQVVIQGGWTSSGLAVNMVRRHSRSVPSSHESELLVTEGRLSARPSRSADGRFPGLPSLPESNLSLEVGGGIVQSSKSVTFKRSGVALSSSAPKVKATGFDSQSRLTTYRVETPSRHRSAKGSLASFSSRRDLETAMVDIARRLFDRKSQEEGIYAEYERASKNLYESAATSQSALLRRSGQSLERATSPFPHDLRKVSSRSSQRAFAATSKQHIAEVTIAPIEITPVVQPEAWSTARPHGSRHMLRSPYDSAGHEKLLSEHYERHALARARSPSLWNAPKGATGSLSRPSSQKQLPALAKTSKTAVSKSQERLAMRSSGSRKPSQGSFTKPALSKTPSREMQSSRDIIGSSKSAKALLFQGFGPTADKKTFFDAQDSPKTAADVSPPASTSSISIQAPQKPLIQYPSSVVETQDAFTKPVLSKPSSEAPSLLTDSHDYRDVTGSTKSFKATLAKRFGPTADQKTFFDAQDSPKTASDVSFRASKGRIGIQAPQQPLIQHPSSVVETQRRVSARKSMDKGFPGSPQGALSVPVGATVHKGLETTKQRSPPTSPPVSKSLLSEASALQTLVEGAAAGLKKFSITSPGSPRGIIADVAGASPQRTTSGFLEPTKSPKIPPTPTQASILNVPVQQAAFRGAATVTETGKTVGLARSATTAPSFPLPASSVLADTSSPRQLTESWTPRATSGTLDPTKSPRGVPQAPRPSSRSIIEQAPKSVQPTGSPLVPSKSAVTSAALSFQEKDIFSKRESSGQLVKPSPQGMAMTTEKRISGPFPGVSTTSAGAVTSTSTLKTMSDTPASKLSQMTSLVPAKAVGSASVVGSKTSAKLGAALSSEANVGRAPHFGPGHPATVFAPSPFETPMLLGTEKSASQSSIGSPSLALNALGPASPVKKASELASPGEIRRLLEAKGSPTSFKPKRDASQVDIPSPPQLPAESSSPLPEELTITGDRTVLAPGSQGRPVSAFTGLSQKVEHGQSVTAKGSDQRIVPLERSVSDLKPSTKRSSSLLVSATADDKYASKALRVGSGPGELDTKGSQSALKESGAVSSATKIAGDSSDGLRRASGLEVRPTSETAMKLSSTSVSEAGLGKACVPRGSSDLLASSTKSSEELISRDLIIDAREQEAYRAPEATEAAGVGKATSAPSATSLGSEQKVTALQERPSAEQIIDAKERWSIPTDQSADAAGAAKASASDSAFAGRRVSSVEEGKAGSSVTSPQGASVTSPAKKKGKKGQKVLKVKRGSATSTDDENRSISDQIAEALSAADFGDMPLQVNMTIDLVPPKATSPTAVSPRGVLSPVHIEKKMIVESCKDGHVEVKVPPVFIDSPDGKHVSNEALNVSVSVDIGKHAKEGHKCDEKTESSKEAAGSDAKP